MTVKQVEDFYQQLFAFLDEAGATDGVLDDIHREGERAVELVRERVAYLERVAARELALDNSARNKEIM